MRNSGKALTVVLGAVVGAVTLSVLSALQKKALGVALASEGFLAPALFGFLSGGLLGLWQARLAALNARLNSLVRERTTRLEAILDTVPCGIAEMTTDGTILYNNRYYQRLLGYGENELAGVHVKALQASPQEGEALGAYLGRLVSVQPSPAVWSGRNLARDGRAVDVEVAWDYKRDEAGEVVGFIYATQDVAERKRWERSVLESEERFRKLAEQAPISIMTFDLDGRITFVNDWHTMVFAGGLKDREWYLEKRVTELPGMTKAGVAEEMNRVLRGEYVFLDDVYWPEFERGEEGYQNVRGIPLFREDRVMGGILLREDITARKRMERDLIASRDQAEAANRAKSEFLATMSHELRTPLNGAMGMLQILGDTSLDDVQRQYVQIALQCAQNLTRLLGDILDISTIEAGRFRLVEGEVHVAAVVELIAATFGQQSKAKGLDLSWSVDPSIPGTLLGDEARLRQVLFNLAGNAIKFTSKGSIRVEAHPLPASRAGTCRVLFSVSDTGRGMPDHKLARLFEAFTQDNEVYTREHEGAGLGLYVVKRLVSLMGGKISVSSEEGKGTDVHFSLAFRAPEARPEEPVEKRRAAPHPLPPASRGRVLVVEDEVVNRDLLVRLLKRHGYDVVCAADGGQALEMLAREQLDIVLMDIQLPIMSGVEATRRIRSDSSGRLPSAIPIIAVTAYAMLSDREKFLAEGMNDYIAKPVEKDELLKVMAAHIR